MLPAKKIIEEAELLSPEDRTFIIDELLRSLNPTISEIDKEWIKVAQRRLEELRSGKVKAISGEEVFKKIKARFAL